MAASTDHLKWFGEGFDGFPKRLPEDCVQYTLYIINEKLSQKEIVTRLEAVRKEATKLSNKLLTEYIWQRDGFNLKLELNNEAGLKCLSGLTNYGDSVEDEWLIVYLLRELSSLFDDLWIKVVDTDGEFLLIEAANALPRWLNPEIADNRVWINNNKLRIIPLIASDTTQAKTAPISRPLTQQEAYNVILSKSSIIIHSPLIEAESFYRLNKYPAQIQDSLHHALITIPRKLAYLIHENKASISPATEAFYLRDPIALKSLQQTATNSPTLPPVDLVTTSVKFTKVLYAQLKSQHFEPPSMWRAVLQEPESLQQPKFERLQLGLKVTSGYEMLLSDSKNRDNSSVRTLQILLSDLSEGTSLPSDGEMADWKDSTRSDSESWLDINFEDFEKELAGKKARNANNDFKAEERSKGPAGAIGPDLPHGFGDAKTQKDLQKMVERFESFMNDENAGIDGAELDEMDEDDDDDDEDVDDSDDEDEDKEVSFDEQEFARMMREMMGLPPTSDIIDGKSTNTKAKKARFADFEDSDSDEEEDEAAEMQKVMARMEAELNEAGALDLDPTPKKMAALAKQLPSSDSRAGGKANNKGKGKVLVGSDGEDDEESEGEVNIDFNLAKNLLESFKSQAGMAGPGGNLLGMLGMQLPRDEEEDDDDGEEPVRAGQRGRRFS